MFTKDELHLFTSTLTTISDLNQESYKNVRLFIC